MLKKLSLLLTLIPVLTYAQESLTPPSNNQPLVTLHAKGEQIYQCVLQEGVYAWRILAPDAQLYDAQGHLVGKHYGGPTWEYKDHSRVIGRVLQKVPSLSSTAIDSLLLEANVHKGQGLFATISFISRINTRGGLSPDSGCDGNHLGSEHRAGYQADYVFYTKR